MAGTAQVTVNGNDLGQFQVVKCSPAGDLLTISTALAEAAALRTETRGSHWREDHPDRDDTRAGHIDSWWAPDGTIPVEWTYAPSTDPSTTTTEVTT